MTSSIATILFTDVVDSTALMQRLGDERAGSVFERHHRMLRDALAASGGEELQWLGDGQMAAFASPADAVRCAVAMQQGAARPIDGERLRVRVGLNVGEVIRDAGGGYFLRLLNSRNGDSGEGAVLGIDHLARRRIGRYGLIAKSPLPDDAVRHRLTIAEDRRLQKQLVALWIEVEFFNDSNAIAGIFQRNVCAVPFDRKISRRNLIVEFGIQSCNGQWPAQFCRTRSIDQFNGFSFSVGVRGFQPETFQSRAMIG